MGTISESLGITSGTPEAVVFQEDLDDIGGAGETASTGYQQYSVDDLEPFANSAPSVSYQDFTGEKYFGGFGPTSLFRMDYWTLRARSAQLFNENLYARGLIRRLVTNIINTGLTLESTPIESLLGLPEDSLADWSEDVENRFMVWGDNPRLCDYEGRRTFGELQRDAYREALIEGDVLVILMQDQNTKLPQIRLIAGGDVQTPLMGGLPAPGNEIIHGVEIDERKRHVAYHVIDDEGQSQRVPAFGENSGRRIAWMVYATDKRADDVRGCPLLSIVLQSIKEIDRYRDSTQRKATVNSILAMFIQKEHPKMGSLPITGASIKRGSVAATNSDGTTTTRKIGQMVPGVVLEELNHGETPKVHSNQGTDVNFPIFEAAVIQAIAWAHEIPPEILRLTFGHNYGASQASINEFKMYIDPARVLWGDGFNDPLYEEWFISSVLTGKVRAVGFLESWQDPMKYDEFGAWLATDWSGAIKPATDIVKQGKGYKTLVEEGWITNGRTSRELTGTKFSHNIKILRRENLMKAEAMRPLLELQREFGGGAVDTAVTALEDQLSDIRDTLDQLPGGGQ